MNQMNQYATRTGPRRLLSWDTIGWNTNFTLAKAIILLCGGLLVYYIAVSVIMVDDLKTEGSLLKVESPANPIP